MLRSFGCGQSQPAHSWSTEQLRALADVWLIRIDIDHRERLGGLDDYVTA